MTRARMSRYWSFQLVGWGMFGLINVFYAFLFQQFTNEMVCRLLFIVEIGIIYSHFMRSTILRNRLLFKPINQQIVLFLILTLLFSSLFSLTQTPFEVHYGLSALSRKVPSHIYFFYNLSAAFILFFIRTSIYFMYH